MKKTLVFLLLIQYIVACSYTPKRSIHPKSSLTKSMEKKIPYQLGDSLIHFSIYQKNNTTITYFNMHDDENTAVESAKSVIDKVGGKLIEILASGNRNISFTYQGMQYEFDPNRIYTPKGIKKTLQEKGNYSQKGDSIVTKFANYIVDSLLFHAKTIVTLHNNSEGNYSIYSYKKGEIYEKDAAKVSVNPKKDPDDFFYVTEATYFQYLSKKGYNVILQDNIKVTDDGSLSVYCGYNTIAYMNIEAQKGHLEEQIKMLYSLREVMVNSVN